MATKLLVDGPGIWAFNVTLEIGRLTTIGRSSDNVVALQDRSISSRHAEITYEMGDWVVRDLGSSNGSLVNGRKFTEHKLKDGDILKFGQCEVVFLNADANKHADPWETRYDFKVHEEALRQAIDHPRPDEGVHIPTFIGQAKGVTAPEKEVGVENASMPNAFEPIPGVDMSSTPATSPEMMTPDDTLWVAETLAGILGELAKARGSEEAALYQVVLRQLKAALDADNGFVMVADGERNRWVIKSWIGDASQWTTYEKEHPVPLTVANKAYMTRKSLSNVGVGGGPAMDASASMMKLNVVSYIATPLLVQNKRKGVLYFDTRKVKRKFALKHVRLLERVGGYILEIESQGK
ncbi:MAG: FHA domain-containing protein [Candidatus Sumerlaeia bacterium]|nr:FHA domain-containing protein [Candidatus Sumerlaeia bacterium]